MAWLYRVPTWGARVRKARAAFTVVLQALILQRQDPAFVDGRGRGEDQPDRRRRGEHPGHNRLQIGLVPATRRRMPVN